jgi:hypothetical protein
VVARQYIRVAMRAGRVVGIARRVVPGAARQSNNPRPDGVDSRDSGETRAPVIEYAHHLAIPDTALAGVGWVDREGLSSGCLAPGADRAGIHLAVQFVPRLT